MSLAMTWPYSLTRFGSIRYIQLYILSGWLYREHRGYAPLVEEDAEHDIVAEAGEPVQDWHLNAEAVW
jgi:hypothetical protein